METTNKKEKIRTAFWKRQAYILKSEFRKCRECVGKEARNNLDLYFKSGGANCLDCPDSDNNRDENGNKKS